MQRYFIDEPLQSLGQLLQLDGEIYHHIVRVMRQEVGQSLIVVDSDQRAAKASIQTIDSDSLQVSIDQWLDSTSELPIDVSIACGLSKNQKLDWIVQKGTELGMARFIPVALKRDVVKWPAKKRPNRQQRLQKIAQEAAEQSHRQRVPIVEPWTDFTELLSHLEHYDYLLVADEEEVGSHQLVQTLQTIETGQSLLIIFGSEGGFDRLEIEQLQTAGFVTCGLGPRILRAETAPLYFLSACSYQLEMGKTNEVK